MVTLKKIDIGSAFRIGALLTAVLTIVIFIPLFICQLSILPSMFSSGSFRGDFGSNATFDNTFLQGASVVTFLLVAVCGTVIYAVIGGIFAAIYAFAYNIISRQFGGLQIEVSGIENALPASVAPMKAKNAGFFDSDFEQG
jgi:hypothetical protein